MRGIYLTEQGKQEIEAELIGIENEVINYAEDDLCDIASIQTRYHTLKEILSSAIILPVQESWKSMVEGDDDYEHYIENIICFPTSYPNGVIIQPEL